MFTSPTNLPESARSAIAEALNATLSDGVDLHSQIKVAHWNIKGPHFAALHPLFDTYATEIAGFNDAIAERAVTLGGLTRATSRRASKESRLKEYPAETTRDLEHAKLLIERIEAYLAGLRGSRDVAERHKDQDTVDLLTGVVQAFEKNAWFLRATTEETR